MLSKPTRIILCIKDVTAITGKSERTARRILRTIKKQNPDTTACGVTIFHFCRYTGIDPNELKPFL